MTTDALVWLLVSIGAFFIAVAIVLHEIGLYLRCRRVTRALDDVEARRQERQAASDLWPSRERDVLATPIKRKRVS